MPDFSSQSYSQVDGSNTQAAPDGMPEAIAANRVGGVVRALMGAGKRFYDRINPTISSTGAANVYALTYAQNPAALVKGETFSFFAHQTNTGAATFNIAGFAPRALVTATGSPLTAGAIVSGAVHTVIYDGASYRLQQFSTANVLLTGSTTLSGTLNVSGATTLTSASVAGSRVLTLADVGATKGLDADLLDGQHGSYYLAATNLTGSLPNARLSGDYSFGNLTLGGGSLLLRSAGAKYVSFQNASGSEEGLVWFDASAVRIRSGGGPATVFQNDGNVVFNGAGGGVAISTIRADVINAQAAANSKLPLTGGNVTGQLSLVDSNLRLTRGGSQRFVVCDGTNVGFAGQDGNFDFYVNDAGAVWTAQLGDLNARIEARADAHAQNAINHANTKFEQLRLTGFAYSSAVSFNTAGSGYVITGYIRANGQAGDVSGLHFAQVQGYSPSRGWVACYND